MGRTKTMGRAVKTVVRLLIRLILAGTLAAGAGAYWFIVIQPGDEIGEAHIERVLAVESPVYYRDGRTVMGVFFQADHRRYLPFSRIPATFVNAIVAAEDHDFFTHCGVDIPGIMRAMWANIRAGRVVQGGSTLTQQAAKNLFKRKGRSLRAKLKELLYALRLEHRYSKEKILEFYANQFYVSGNGRGLGVAARYYFSKPAKELTLIESAFIAGSVKRPNYYNPFVKKDPAAARAARRHAKERTAYVLRQMYGLGMITKKELDDNLGREIPFRKGKMSYGVNTIMDMVREALAEPEVEEALVAHGIDNVATSGIRIFTTIDHDLQRRAEESLRRRLSEITVRLQGYDPAAVAAVCGKRVDRGGAAAAGDFICGRVTAADNNGLAVRWGRGGANRGIIDAAGLMNVAAPLATYEGQRWSRAGTRDVARLKARLTPGSLVYAAVRDFDGPDGTARLDLMVPNGVEGAVVVLHQGEIRALVGGFANRFFNRAVDARRLMGSVTKPLLYAAAIQLGWNPLDLIRNRRDAFVFFDQVYFPRPDHISPYQWVSLNWAGIKSENVASVWLLAHLTDRLSPAQFKEVVEGIGLARRKDESYREYARRIRDDNGVLVNGRVLKRMAFAAAVKTLGPDLLFDGLTRDYGLLNHFHYHLEGEAEVKDNRKETELRQRIMRYDFTDQEDLAAALDGVRDWAAGLADDDGAAAWSSWWQNPDGPWFYRRDEGGEFAFGHEPPGEGWHRLAAADVARIWIAAGRPPEFWDEIRLAGLLRAGTVARLQQAMAEEYQRLSALPAYGPDVLYQVPDFRILAGLRYVIGLARRAGVQSPLQPVLSFPLGSNVVGLLEVARLYETLVTGVSRQSGRDRASAGLMLIDRIENSDGEVVYRARRRATRVLAPATSLAVSDIMRGVVRYGTGRHAYRSLRLRSPDPQQDKALAALDLPIPALGKTGTANKFRNSAFAGYLPAPAPGGGRLGLGDGFTLAAYVGYDDNKSMVRHSTHITGSSGGLLVWTDVAQALVTGEDFARAFDPAALAAAGVDEIPLAYPDLGQIPLSGREVRAVADFDDLLLGGAGPEAVRIGPATIAFGRLDDQGRLRPQRRFTPYWRIEQ